MSRRFTLVLALLSLFGCGSPPTPETPSSPVDAVPPIASEPTEKPAPLSGLDELPLEIERLMAPWSGDLDGMAERRVVRILTVHNPMLYHLNGARQAGLVYEAATEFEKALNRKLGRKRLKIVVLIIPVERDQLLPRLIDGHGDIVAANLTITSERLEQVDFSTPALSNVSEVVVTGPDAPLLGSIEDLAGREVSLRPSSSYWSSMERLNETLRATGKPAVKLTPIHSYLEDHDLLEMVNAGLLPWTIVDSHKAKFWAQVLKRISVRSDLTVRDGGQIGWAFRKDSPRLREVVDEFVRKHRKGTLFGNVIYKRYLEDTAWLEGAMQGADRNRMRETSPYFRRFSSQYNFDWRLVAAQAYQESALKQDLRSHAGAIGVMQLMPIAAKQVGISDIDVLENNIHAGVKYMRYIVDHYLDDDSLDPTEQHLLALAAYNAGPTRIKRLRALTESKGLDPNVWFDNVEIVVARNVGIEPVRYVSNIVKFYVAYGALIESSAMPKADEG